MKRRRLIKWGTAGLWLCLGMSILAGCKNTTVDYDMDGVTESGESSRTVDGNGEEGLKQFADESHWSEEWTAENSDGENYQCIVDVDISVPDAEQMYVIEVEESSFGEAEKERIAEKIFGTEKIYYNDIAHLPKKELTRRYSSYQQLPYFFMENGETISAERLSLCEEAMKTAGDAYIPVRTYDADEYQGKRDGLSYELSFGEGDTAIELYLKYMGDYLTYSGQADFIESRCKNIYLVPKDIYQICPDEVREVENLFYIAGDPEVADENLCGLSEEEARQMAQSFAESLDLDYSVYAGFRPLWWSKGTSLGVRELNYLTDGYVFYFDAGIENLSFVQYGTQGNYRDLEGRESEERQYSLRSRMEIYVNENGIIGMRAYNPVHFIDVSGGVKLLALETVKEIIKEYGNQNKLLSLNEWTEYTGIREMRLIYFRVRDKENPGHYSYIPTWRLSNEHDLDENLNAESIEKVILINAIDGSVIDFYDEV